MVELWKAYRNPHTLGNKAEKEADGSKWALHPYINGTSAALRARVGILHCHASPGEQNAKEVAAANMEVPLLLETR